LSIYFSTIVLLPPWNGDPDDQSLLDISAWLDGNVSFFCRPFCHPFFYMLQFSTILFIDVMSSGTSDVRFYIESCNKNQLIENYYAPQRLQFETEEEARDIRFQYELMAAKLAKPKPYAPTKFSSSFLPLSLSVTALLLLSISAPLC
jgi:hypothetical protein